MFYYWFYVYLVFGGVFLGDKEAIGVIVDDLISVLENLILDEDTDLMEKDNLIFGVKVLKYFAFLCLNDGMDLDLVHEYRDIV